MKDLSQPNIYWLLRHFRHDLLNDLQLLLGHLQLGRSQEVIYEDASKMVARIQAVSSLFGCGDDELATMLWHWGFIAEQRGICLQQKIEPLPAPLAQDSLLALERLGSLLLAELSKLEAGKPFLHINISHTSPQFLLKFAPLADETPMVLSAAATDWRLEKTDADWRYSYVH